jgi:C1A family cysteine protease
MKYFIKNRKYSWIPDVPDQRDFIYAAVMRRLRTLPSKVDLRQACSPVEDQSRLGSCTANALVGLLEFIDRKDGNLYIDQSRLFVYYNERLIEHRVKEDSGAMIRDGIKSLKKYGSCPESKWPYIIEKFAVKPSKDSYELAKKHTITSYHRLNTLNEMKTCLASGYPFVFGFSVYESFESRQIAQSGKLNMPKPDERKLGGHAVMAVGYVESEKRFIVRNSWGDNWGLKGYFTIPYDYLASRNLSDDLWVVIK